MGGVESRVPVLSFLLAFAKPRAERLRPMIKKLTDGLLQRIDAATEPSSRWRDPRTGNLSLREGFKSAWAWCLIFASCLVK
jgi:hypothetical protein